MPIKSFFSGRKPEENNAAPVKPANEDVLETGLDEIPLEDFSSADFNGMQSLDMYADEDSAAGGFAALLQSEEGEAGQDADTVFYGDETSFVEEESDQNVGEAVFQNLFAEEPVASENDFFAPQQDFAQSNDDFFTPQPSDYADTSMQGDDFFAAQPAEFKDAQPVSDFFAEPMQEAQPFADATFTLPEPLSVPQEEMVQPLPDTTFEQAAPVFSLETMEESIAPVEQDFAVPFDIAVPEQTQSLEMEFEEEVQEEFDTDYIPKRKYTPVFTQPIPSALDELRAGIVKPASPISSIAATQIPVVVTAAEAAAAEVAAKTAAEEAATQAAEEEITAREAVERVTEEAHTLQYGYTEPSPEEMGFGYMAPAQENAPTYDNYNNTYAGSLSAEEFKLPITEDVPAWEEHVNSTESQSFMPLMDNFSGQAEASKAAFFDYDSAPVARGSDDVNATEQDFLQQPVVPNMVEAESQNYLAAETPADYANNLEAMFSNDGTYAAVDAIEQFKSEDAFEPNSFDTTEVENIGLETPTFEEGGFDTAPVFEDVDSTLSEFESDGFVTSPENDGLNQQHNGSTDAFSMDEVQDDGFMPLSEAPMDNGEEITSPGVDNAGFDFSNLENEPVKNAPTFNPFESEEWLDDEVDKKSEKAKENHHFVDDDNVQRVKVKKKKSIGGGGNGGGKKSNLLLFIVLGVLAIAIAVVAIYLLLGNKDKAPAASSASLPPVMSSSVASSSSEVVSSVPQVDPIPRDEWYMKVANRQTVLPADFKIDTKNCSDGIPVDTRIVEALNQMIKDGNATGLKLVVTSGYRTYERQKTNYESQVRQQVAAGKSKAEAEAAAAIITAPPGTSEHNLGLSVDIMSKSFKDYDAKYEETAEAKWLLQNAANYGFILRYAKTTQSVTGFEYEPWHYRYVGVDQAKKIKDSGLTLEEYLAQDAPTGIPTAGGEIAAASEANSSASSTASSAASLTASSSSKAAQ